MHCLCTDLAQFKGAARLYYCSVRGYISRHFLSTLLIKLGFCLSVFGFLRFRALVFSF